LKTALNEAVFLFLMAMNALVKIFSYPFTIVFYLLFGLTLLVFELLQRMALSFFGYQAHKMVVVWMNGITLILHWVLFNFVSFKIEGQLPINKPVIIVSNHQSMWDIPPLIWFLRSIHPKFISKIELGKGIPSVSYNLRKGGSVLIDRKDPAQATNEIQKVARYISEHNRSVVIFPEGTRSRDGMPKKFYRKGLLTLFVNAPEAYILPVSINNSWKLQRFGMFPIPMFNLLTFYAHPAIKVNTLPPEILIDKVEKLIKSGVKGGDGI